MKISIVFLFLAGLCSLNGALITVAGGGNISNAAYNFGNNGAATTFDASHQLTAIGNNLGAVGAAIPPLVGVAGNFPGSIFQCINLGAGCGNIGASFGTASTGEVSGNYFVAFGFSLSDLAAADANTSITYAGAGNGANQVIFTNTSGVPVSGRVGAVLAIHGFFGGQAGAVVGAALDGAISWNGNAAQEAQVVLFGSSLQGQPTSVSTMGVGASNLTYLNCGFGFGCNDYVAWGVSLLNGGNPITIGPGQTLTLNGALSVIVDPMMNAGVFSLDPLSTVPQGTILPDFGANDVSPEPATLSLVAGALFGLAWKLRRAGLRG